MMCCRWKLVFPLVFIFVAVASGLLAQTELKNPASNQPSAANEAPPPFDAKGPRSAADALASQEAWAKHLGVQLEITNSIDQTFRLIPPGEFWMGTSANDRIQFDGEKPQHKVRLTEALYVGVTEVTQGQWTAVMKTAPWSGKNYVQEGATIAANYVNHEDALDFVDALNQKELKNVYRLPTEAEWEYACRAGTITRWSFGNGVDLLNDHAWHHENANNINRQYAHAVGLKGANPFGLKDMHGNVWEWCQDVYDPRAYEKRSGTAENPLVERGTVERVVRGGCWYADDVNLRSSRRGRNVPDTKFSGIGFRVVRSVKTP